MKFSHKLPIPKELKQKYPLSVQLKNIKEKRDKEIKDILSEKDKRFLVIIGPCSADNISSVLEYNYRLAKLQEEVKDKLFIIPRIYTNKPRTTGMGYKGMLHQPNPNKKEDLYKGLENIRLLLMKVLKETELSGADELLYPENHRYISDLLSYVAVGARSVENQFHRLTASGLNIPVGMKNPTSGDLSVMINAISAGQQGHRFIYRGWEVESRGNSYTHAVLRGYTDKKGQPIPNYHYDELVRVNELYAKSGLNNPAVIIDTNHSNSGKRYLKQIDIAKEIMQSRLKNSDIKKLVKGLMIESYIEDGSQHIGENVFGKSITDPCLGWEKSKRLIMDIAEQV